MAEDKKIKSKRKTVPKTSVRSQGKQGFKATITGQTKYTGPTIEIKPKAPKTKRKSPSKYRQAFKRLRTLKGQVQFGPTSKPITSPPMVTFQPRGKYGFKATTTGKTKYTGLGELWKKVALEERAAYEATKALGKQKSSTRFQIQPGKGKSFPQSQRMRNVFRQSQRRMARFDPDLPAVKTKFSRGVPTGGTKGGTQFGEALARKARLQAAARKETPRIRTTGVPKSRAMVTYNKPAYYGPKGLTKYTPPKAATVARKPRKMAFMAKKVMTHERHLRSMSKGISSASGIRKLGKLATTGPRLAVGTAGGALAKKAIRMAAKKGISRIVPGVGTALDVAAIGSATKEGYKAYQAGQHFQQHEQILKRKFKPGKLGKGIKRPTAK